VLETSTSPGAASDEMRAPVCTAIPAPSIHEFALASMQPGANLELEIAHPLDDRARTPDRPCGSVETCEEAIAGGVHSWPRKRTS